MLRHDFTRFAQAALPPTTTEQAQNAWHLIGIPCTVSRLYSLTNSLIYSHVCALTHSHICSLTRSLARSLTHSLTGSLLAHSITHLFTHSLTCSPTHSHILSLVADFRLATLPLPWACMTKRECCLIMLFSFVLFETDFTIVQP